MLGDHTFEGHRIIEVTILVVVLDVNVPLRAVVEEETAAISALMVKKRRICGLAVFNLENRVREYS